MEDPRPRPEDFPSQQLLPEVQAVGFPGEPATVPRGPQPAVVPDDPDFAAERPRIETMTLNGFEIIRPTDVAAVRTQTGEHVFVVLAPDGTRSQVLVKIDDEAVSYVERITRRQLAAGNSFWAAAAERLLSDYLWDQGKIPPAGKLSLKEIDREQLILAERWDK